MTVPHYISENQSDKRGIKHSWYAIEDGGNFIFWTFSQFRETPHGNQSAGERDEGAPLGLAQQSFLEMRSNKREY